MIALLSLERVFGRIKPLESGFLCLVGILKEDHHGQYKETTYHRG
jgi:hypothetical protein